jgi:hypothetical protein
MVPSYANSFPEEKWTQLPSWQAVHNQARRWLRAGCSEVLIQDLRAVLCLAEAAP